MPEQTVLLIQLNFVLFGYMFNDNIVAFIIK